MEVRISENVIVYLDSVGEAIRIPIGNFSEEEIKKFKDCTTLVENKICNYDKKD